MKNKTFLLIFILFIFSLTIRIIPIFYNAISFHYDMSRDAFAVREILNGHLKIQGPPTSTPGLFHGVLYYYLLAPFYFIAQGDPKIAALFMAALSSLTVVPIMLLTKEIFKSTKLVILSGFLFALSAESVQYALWLSNPSPALLTVGLFFYSLWLWQKGKRKGFYLALLFAGLSTQFQFFLIYLFIITFIFKYEFRLEIKPKELFYGFLLSLLVLCSFVISSIKFNSYNQILNGFFAIAAPSQFDFRVQFSDYLLDYLNRFVDIFVNNFFPMTILLGGLFGLAVLLLVRKNKFIFFCLLSSSLLFLFGGHNSSYVNVGMVTPAILAMVYFVQLFSGKSKLLVAVILMVIFFSNSFMVFKNFSKGQTSLVIPKDMVLNNQLALIDKTYVVSKGQPFSINTISLPIWTNTTWAYLYDWYGRKKYGYVPSFYGRDQIGLPGQKELAKTTKPEKTTFLIIEPTTGIPLDLYNKEIESENGKTKLLQEIDYNQLRLQVRDSLNND